MPAPHRLVLLALVLAACGDAAEPLELPEVCGAPGPVRVLELPPDLRMNQEPQRIGERVFYETASSTGQHAWWTTGPCGESPTRLPVHLSDPFTIDRWPDLALLCDHETNSIVSAAPTGPLEPRVVFFQSGCSPLWSAFGPIVRHSGNEGGTVRLHRWPDDPRDSIGEPVALTDLRLLDDEPIALAGAHLFALTSDNELVRIELPGDVVTLEQTGVGRFKVSPDGRFVLWTGPNSDWADLSSMMLSDIETGVTVGLGDGDWGDNYFAFHHPGHLVFRSGDRTSRIYRLPGLDSIAVPPGYQVDGVPGLNNGRGPLPDGRWILYPDDLTHLLYLDPVSGETTPMFNRPGTVLMRAADGAMALQIQLSLWSPWDWLTDQGPLWYLPFDGSPPQLMAERSTVHTYPPNDRQLLTVIDVDSEKRGTLVLLDRGDLEAREIDDHVYGGPMVWAQHHEPDLIRYSVLDGERSGVWMARLPPAP